MTSPARELRSLWKDKLEAWISIRVYFRQRAILLRGKTPEVGRRLLRERWKGPLAFALQGIVILALVVGLAGKFFSLFVRQRPTTMLTVERQSANAIAIVPRQVAGGAFWEGRQERIERDLKIIESEFQAIEKLPASAKAYGPVPYSLVDAPSLFMISASLEPMELIPRNEVISLYRRELQTLRAQLLQARLAPHVEAAVQWLNEAAVAIAFVLAAYIFALMSKIRNERVPAVPPSHAYLYYVVAVLFWWNMGLALSFAVEENLQRYFPASFDAMVADLDATLKSIDDPIQHAVTPADRIPMAFNLGRVALLIGAYMSVRRAARLTAPLVGIVGDAAPMRFYAGAAKVRKDVVFSNIVSFTVVATGVGLLALGYAAARLFLVKFKF